MVLHPGKVAHMIEFEVHIDEVRLSPSARWSDNLHPDRLNSLFCCRPAVRSSPRRWTPSPRADVPAHLFMARLLLVINGDSTIRLRFHPRRSDLEIGSCDSHRLPC